MTKNGDLRPDPSHNCRPNRENHLNLRRRGSANDTKLECLFQSSQNKNQMLAVQCTAHWFFFLDQDNDVFFCPISTESLQFCQRLFYISNIFLVVYCKSSKPKKIISWTHWEREMTTSHLELTDWTAEHTATIGKKRICDMNILLT